MKLKSILLAFCILTMQATSQIPKGDIPFLPALGNLKFNRPIWMGENPAIPGMFLVLEQHTGTIHTVEKVNGSWVRKEFTKINGISNASEQGLLSFAFHPDFKNNRKYYYYKNPSRTMTEVREGTASQDFRKGTETTRLIFSIKRVAGNHNGGTILFSPNPADPYLYISMGDGGGGGDKFGKDGNGQNKNVLFGKILRIDINKSENGNNYAIPSDNPFTKGGGSPEIYAWGLRNPWKMSFDRKAPYQLWVGDVGQKYKEEIDLVDLGDNLGWRVKEGTTCFNVNTYTSPLSTCNSTGLKEPLVDFSRSEASSIIGGQIYRGNTNSAYYGVYLFSDHYTRNLWGLTQKNGVQTELAKLGRTTGRVAAFTADLAGNLYAIRVEDGVISRLDLGKLATVDTSITSIKDHTTTSIFKQLVIKRNHSRSLNIIIHSEGNHKVEIFDLKGALMESYMLKGGTLSTLILKESLKGLYLLKWTRKDQAFSKRIYF